MSGSIEMIQLDQVKGFFPDVLWARSIEIDKVVTTKIVESGELGPAYANCPVCDAGKIEKFTVKHGLRVDECLSCGFRFTNPPPTIEQLRMFYNSEAKRIENEIFEATRVVRLPIFKARVELIRQYVKDGALLDVGGAIGIFIDALMDAEAPFNLTVVDLNDDSIGRLRARHPNIEARLGDLFDHRGAYDVITVWDTIEHLRDVNRVASHLFDLLRPGGYLFVSTPNIDGFEHWVGQHRHPQVEPLSHLNYFSLNTLKMLFSRHGFAVLHFLTPNGSLDIVYVERMLRSGEADLGKLGEFLCEKLQRPEVAEDFAKLISKHCLAGNVVMIAQRPTSTSI